MSFSPGTIVTRNATRSHPSELPSTNRKVAAILGIERGRIWQHYILISKSGQKVKISKILTTHGMHKTML